MTTDPTTPEGHAELLSEGRALLRCFNRAPQMTEAEVDAAEAWYSWQLDNGEALLDALDEADHEIERQRGDLVIERRRAGAAEAALDRVHAAADKWGPAYGWVPMADLRAALDGKS